MFYKSESINVDKKKILGGKIDKIKRGGGIVK